MAALAATRDNAPIRAFDEHLAACGKLRNRAPIASRRTRITHLVAIAREHIKVPSKLVSAGHDTRLLRA